MRKVEDIEIQGWKGESGMQVEEFPEFFRITEWRKRKKDGQVDKTVNIIKRKDVLYLWRVVIEPLPMWEKYGYKYLVRKLCEHRKIYEQEGMEIEQMMEAFNGGKHRAKYYFPLLYYPLKVLEDKKLIDYHGRGGITRIKEGSL